jgi:geranylgeranyl reductase family protein
MKHLDVLIVGAGPSGCSAALTLQRSGLTVAIVDKAEFPRDKCCGDGLTTSALRQLERIGLDPRTLSSFHVVTDTAWRSPSGYVSELALPEEDGIRIAVARREDLDAALVQLVRDADVHVFESHTITSVDTSARGIQVVAGDKTFNSRYLIAADGMWSATRKLVSSAGKLASGVTAESPYLGNIHAFRQYFKNVTGPAQDRLFVSFEPDLLPGYLWSFPLGDGRVNIGFGIERQEGRSTQFMKQVWPDILQRPHIREELGEFAEPEQPHKAWPIPAEIQTDLLTSADGRVLFVGDAARVVDPLTGEGIGQALETGHAAATAIIEHGDRHAHRAAKYYRNYIRRGMAVDNSVAGSIAKLVRHEKAARAVIRLAPKLNKLDHYAIRWVFEDNPRAAALTPWRWRERFGNKQTAAYTRLMKENAHQ